MNNYETLRMPELRSLAKERKLKGYSRLRKAELIAFLQKDDRRNDKPSTSGVSTWELERFKPEVDLNIEVPLTKRQLKCRRNKNSKLNKKFRNLSAEVNDLKSRMEEMEDN